MKFSETQRRARDAILGPDTGIDNPVLLPGPIQSGKSVVGIPAFVAWASKNWAGHDFGLLCMSNAQLQGVLVKYARQFANDAQLGFKSKSDYYEIGSAYGSAPNRFFTALGSNALSPDRISGWTLAGFVCDEAEKVASASPDFLNVAFDRCTAVPGAKVVMICNPGGPLHPLKTDWIDTRRATHIPFQLTDNPMQPPDALQRMARRYGEGTAMYRRLAQGQWAATEGAIYPQVLEATGEPSDKANVIRYGLAVDYGKTNPTHALLMAQYDNGETWALREWHMGRCNAG